MPTKLVLCILACTSCLLIGGLTGYAVGGNKSESVSVPPAAPVQSKMVDIDLGNYRLPDGTLVITIDANKESEFSRMEIHQPNGEMTMGPLRRVKGAYYRHGVWEAISRDLVVRRDWYWQGQFLPDDAEYFRHLRAEEQSKQK